MIAASFTDLLQKPWSDMNCGEAVVEGLRRQGQHRASLHVPTDPVSAARCVASGFYRWDRVGSETCNAIPGDLIVSEGEMGWHVSLCVNRQYVLTSHKRQGVRMMRIGAISDIEGVYRWGGGE